MVHDTEVSHAPIPDEANDVEDVDRSPTDHNDDDDAESYVSNEEGSIVS